jgi:hypothetical protein
LSITEGEVSVKLRILGVALILFLVGACGDEDVAEPATTPASTTPTSTTAVATTAAPVATTAAEDATLCDAFLQFRGAQDFETMAPAIATVASQLGESAPNDVIEAMNAFISGDFGDLQIGAAIGSIRGHIMPLCQQRYYAAVTGASSGPIAAQEFFDALVAGDRDVAVSIAQAEVVAQFEPWAGYGASATIDIGEGEFTMQLDEQTAVSCTTVDGVVDRCVRI